MRRVGELPDQISPSESGRWTREPINGQRLEAAPELGLRVRQPRSRCRNPRRGRHGAVCCGNHGRTPRISPQRTSVCRKALLRSASPFVSRLCSSRVGRTMTERGRGVRLGPFFPTRDAPVSDSCSGPPCRVGRNGHICTCSWESRLPHAPKASRAQPSLLPNSRSSQAFPLINLGCSSLLLGSAAGASS